MCDGERWGTLGVKGPVSSGAKQRGPGGGTEGAESLDEAEEECSGFND